MKKSIRINWLATSRYRTYARDNVGMLERRRRSCGSTKPTMQPKYDDLITFQRRLVDQDKLASSSTRDARVRTTQSFRNQVSTLHSYISYHGKTTQSRIGRELLSQFDEHLKRYIDNLPVTAHTKSDRRSHLRSWRRIADEMLNSGSSSHESKERNPSVTSAFHQSLRQAIAATHEKPKTLARRCGASTSAIQRWLKGAFPNARARPSLHRLERALGLPTDSLVKLAFEQAAQPPVANRASCPPIPYRERLRANTKSFYALPLAQLNSSFRAEWASFFEYKTSRCPRFERSAKGTWRLVPPAQIGKKLPALAYLHGRGAETASMTLDNLRNFFGYLALSEGKRIASTVVDDETGMVVL
ncbi:helix-turn-helix domain-containing protein [Cupriavidus necator]